MDLPPEHVGTGFVYFLRSDQYVKIGYTDNPNRRFRALQGGNPVTLRLLRLEEGVGMQREKWLHERFRGARHRGEWFHLNDDLQQFLGSDQLGGRLVIAEKHQAATYREALQLQHPRALIVQSSDCHLDDDKGWSLNAIGGLLCLFAGYEDVDPDMREEIHNDLSWACPDMIALEDNRALFFYVPGYGDMDGDSLYEDDEDVNPGVPPCSHRALLDLIWWLDDGCVDTEVRMLWDKHQSVTVPISRLSASVVYKMRPTALGVTTNFE